MQPSKEGIFERLKHSLQLLTCSAEMQLSLLPTRVCKADELALDFDEWREIVLHNYSAKLSPEQVSVLAELDDKFQSMEKTLWTDEAVRNDQSWSDVRAIASRALQAFGWPKETPPSYADEYITRDE